MVDTGILSNNMKFPLTNIKWHSVTWPYTMTTPYWSDVVPNSTFYQNLCGFHRTFATGVACRHGTLIPPDTWSCPIWDLQMFFCWDHWHLIIHYITNSLSFTWFNFLPNLTHFLHLTPPIHDPFPDLTSY